jgi:hypothetical protein
MNDLAAHIQQTRLSDTHEHLAAPDNKVFAFGGDTGWPASAVA